MAWNTWITAKTYKGLIPCAPGSDLGDAPPGIVKPGTLHKTWYVVWLTIWKYAML